ncbi:MAG: hypothetical protein IPP49_02620 [Saprospiraceae bacterium]|nr:hypothetical protein [Saprospiraceae bacterium]
MEKHLLFSSDGNIYGFLNDELTKIVFKEENAMIYDMTSTAFTKGNCFLLHGQPETDYFYNYALVRTEVAPANRTDCI